MKTLFTLLFAFALALNYAQLTIDFNGNDVEVQSPTIDSLLEELAICQLLEQLENCSTYNVDASIPNCNVDFQLTNHYMSYSTTVANGHNFDSLEYYANVPGILYLDITYTHGHSTQLVSGIADHYGNPMVVVNEDFNNQYYPNPAFLLLPNVAGLNGLINWGCYRITSIQDLGNNQLGYVIENYDNSQVANYSVGNFTMGNWGITLTSAADSYLEWTNVSGRDVVQVGIPINQILKVKFTFVPDDENCEELVFTYDTINQTTY